MKKFLIFLVAIILCLLIAFGSLNAPFMQQPTSSGAIESAPVSSAESIPTGEPNYDNTDLSMVDLAVDLHRIPADMSDLVEPYRTSWEALCDALGEEETSFLFRSSEEKGVLLEAAASLSYASRFTINGSGLEVTIQYADSYADDCLLLAAVAESILLENVYANANDLETAAILYTYLVTNVEKSSTTSIFDVFDRYEGNADATAGALCFLLLQFDIPATVIKADNGTLVAAKINGQCIYFSPANEMAKEDARGLSCFGMSEDAAQTLCGDFKPPAFADECNPYALGDIFAGCTDWRLDAAGHSLYLAYGSSEFTAAISTSDMVEAHG